MQLEKGAQDVAKLFAVADKSEPGRWSESLVRQCSDALNDLIFLAPWASLPDLSQRLGQIQAQNASSPALTAAFTLRQIDAIPTLRELADFDSKVLSLLPYKPDAALSGKQDAPVETGTFSAELHQWCTEISSLIEQGSDRARARIAELERLSALSEELAQADFDFLYFKSRHLLSIGYNLNERRLDASCYDLLASEARLGNFLAIALGQLPQESWFALGRLLTSAGATRFSSPGAVRCSST